MTQSRPRKKRPRQGRTNSHSFFRKSVIGFIFWRKGKESEFFVQPVRQPLYNPNPELQPAVESDIDGGSGVALKMGRLVSLVPPALPSSQHQTDNVFSAAGKNRGKSN